MCPFAVLSLKHTVSLKLEAIKSSVKKEVTLELVWPLACTDETCKSLKFAHKLKIALYRLVSLGISSETCVSM